MKDRNFKKKKPNHIVAKKNLNLLIDKIELLLQSAMTDFFFFAKNSFSSRLHHRSFSVVNFIYAKRYRSHSTWQNWTSCFNEICNKATQYIKLI